jgi:CHAD domain
MKARRVKKLDPTRTLAENAARIVRVRLDELRSFAPQALDQEQVEAQHDMRIAAKRLRYVLEATEFCFGRAGETGRRRARDLQDVLGEMHDCDVMLPRVRDHLAELHARDAASIRTRAGDAPDLDPRLVGRASHRTAYRGLESLAVYLEARRTLLFDRFVALWLAQEKKGTWDRLARAAERQLGRARKRRRAARRAERASEDLAEAQRAERAALKRGHRAATELAEARRSGGVPSAGPAPRAE